MSPRCHCRTAAGQPCDCCTGSGHAKAGPVWNRPGLDVLSYRIGTHATFFEAMIARLSSGDAPALAGLKTRELSDPAIALLDAWAIVADVLTFYQERVANEGYLRTATERRSVLELARLIGYEPRPGVSATTYLAYTLEKDSAPVEIEPGARAASVPGPGEQMQTFETADRLVARVEWNRLVPRRTEPQTPASILEKGLYLEGTALNLEANDPLLIDFGEGSGWELHRIEKVEIDFDNGRTRVALRASKSGGGPGESLTTIVARYSNVEAFDVSPDAAMTRRVLALLAESSDVEERSPEALHVHLNTVTVPALERELEIARDRHFTKLEPWIDEMLNDIRAAAARIPHAGTAPDSIAPVDASLAGIGSAVKALKQLPSVPPPSPKHLPRAVEKVFGPKADTLPRILASLEPSLQKTFYTIYRNLPQESTGITVHALRVAAAPFGHNAPLRVTDVSNGTPIFAEWEIDEPVSAGTSDGPGPEAAAAGPAHHTPQVLFLDNEYAVAPDSLIVIEKAGAEPVVVTSAKTLVPRSLAAYGLSGKTLQITLPGDLVWLKEDETFASVRNTRVLAGSEKLKMAEVPMTEPVEASEIELDQLYEDLEPGRWLILTGERADVIGPDGQPVPGIKAGELLMLAAVEQRRRRTSNGVEIAQDRSHTFITVAQPLAYRYTRGTVAIYGNVVRATHGETVREILGSGDAATPLQRFALKRSPLTFVSAPTASGVASTLQVRVNDVQWHEVRSLASLTETDRAFVTRTDDEARTAVVFGTGDRGARLPTGTENVKATYRAGIGQDGNVGAGQITLLTTRPLGVKEVINPLRSSGGADREGRDDARRNAPLAVASLDRLVSTRDYADFARTFAGIGKAAAARLSDGRRQIVHVTIAGAGDIPIHPSSDLFRNLYAALHRFGDPHLPIRLEVRERLALVIAANVAVAPDHSWETLEPRIRLALRRAFGFEQASLGHDLVLARAIAAIQRIAGVTYVDVDVFDAVSAERLLSDFATSTTTGLGRRERVRVQRARVERGVVLPAQLACLTPDVPDTLILEEIKS